METAAQSWLVFRLSHSAWLLGLVGFAGQFPIFLFSLLGGAMADRMPRRKLIILTQTLQMIQAFLLAFLTLTHRITVSEIIALAAFLGIVNAFDIPARHAFMVDTVEPEAFSSTIAMNSTAFTSSRMIGPPLAALVIAVSNEGICFLINGFSFLAVLWALLLIRGKHRTYNPKGLSAISAIWEAIVYAFGFLPIRALLLLLGVLNVAGISYTVLMPIFADKILNRGSTGYGTLMGGIGFGALCGAFFVGTRRSLEGVGKVIAVACALFSVSIIAFSFSKSYPISFFLLMVAGFGMMTQTTSTSTMIQSLVPNELRGRVMSIYAIMVVGVAPFGSLIAGALANRYGAPRVVAWGGTSTLAASVWFASLIPRLRPIVRKTLRGSS